MGFRSFLENNLFKVAAVTMLILFAGTAAFAITSQGFFQGTFVDDQGCPWRPVENPETGGNFGTEEELREYVESQGKEMPGNVDFQERDGVLYQQTGECGKQTGGDTSS